MATDPTQIVDVDEINFNPLIGAGKAQAAENRLRNNPFVQKTVHSADTEEMVAKGWEVVRLAKKTMRIRRLKSHDRMLEDKMWCLLHRMGYSHINGERRKGQRIS